MRAARKNDPNLPITLPNLNIFHKIVLFVK